MNTYLIKGYSHGSPRSSTSRPSSRRIPLADVLLDHPAARHAVLAVSGCCRHRAITTFLMATSSSPDRHEDLEGGCALSGWFRRTNANFGMFAAGTLLTALPTVVLFFAVQKYIVGGLTAGSVKG